MVPLMLLPKTLAIIVIVTNWIIRLVVIGFIIWLLFNRERRNKILEALIM